MRIRPPQQSMINSASYLAERAQSKRLLESLEFTRLHLVMADMRVVPFIQFRPGPLRAPISRRAASLLGEGTEVSDPEH
jgi:hypothetical protein